MNPLVGLDDRMWEVSDLDLAERAPVARLAMVEFRKLVDTEAGSRWFLATILAGLACAVAHLVVALQGSTSVGMREFASSSGLALSLVGASAVLLTVPSDWSGGRLDTLLVLEPGKDRVLLAKLSAVAVVGLLLGLVNLGLAAGATAGHHWLSGTEAHWDLQIQGMLGVLGSHYVLVAMAAALALCLGHGPIAWLTYFGVNLLVPVMVWAPLLADSPARRSALAWVDVQLAVQPLRTGVLTPTEWMQVGAVVVVWVVAPLAIAWFRFARLGRA